MLIESFADVITLTLNDPLRAAYTKDYFRLRTILHIRLLFTSNLMHFFAY